MISKVILPGEIPAELSTSEHREIERLLYDSFIESQDEIEIRLKTLEMGIKNKSVMQEEFRSCSKAKRALWNEMRTFIYNWLDELESERQKKYSQSPLGVIEELINRHTKGEVNDTSS